SQWIVEGPVFDVALPALHDRAPHPSVPGLAVRRRVGPREMLMIVGHPESVADPVETQFAIGPLEAQWMCHRDLAAGLHVEPLVHAPEMPAAHVEIQRVDDA